MKAVAKWVRFFGTGGAVGFDTLAAEIILRLRWEFPRIRLILVLPCRNQTQGWHPKDVARHESICGQADKVVYTGDHYKKGCMHKRNRHLVNGSSVCVAYCTKATGGSAYTLDYARKQGRKVILYNGKSA